MDPPRPCWDSLAANVQLSHRAPPPPRLDQLSPSAAGRRVTDPRRSDPTLLFAMHASNVGRSACAPRQRREDYPRAAVRPSCCFFLSFHFSGRHERRLVVMCQTVQCAGKDSVRSSRGSRGTSGQRDAICPCGVDVACSWGGFNNSRRIFLAFVKRRRTRPGRGRTDSARTESRSVLVKGARSVSETTKHTPRTIRCLFEKVVDTDELERVDFVEATKRYPSFVVHMIVVSGLVQ